MNHRYKIVICQLKHRRPTKWGKLHFIIFETTPDGTYARMLGSQFSLLECFEAICNEERSKREDS